MKEARQRKILELIRTYEIETQEELLAYLMKNGYEVTQATVSRDIRELRLTKLVGEHGKQRYAPLESRSTEMTERCVRVLKEAFTGMDAAGNLLVIHTVSGMAPAAGAAIDAMGIKEILGSIAGDDTLMCAVRSQKDAADIMRRLRKIMEE